MRFSRHQQFPPSDPVQERGRRRAKFVGDLKAEIKEAAKAKGLTLSDLAHALDCHKSVVSRALDPSTNVEVLTLFDFAEVLGKEWALRLSDRRQDLGCLFDARTELHQQVRTSWTPVVALGRQPSNVFQQPEAVNSPRVTTYRKEIAAI